MPQTIEELLLGLKESIPTINTDKPEWDKFYTVYMFDNIKYHKLCKENPNTDKAILKEMCYVKDEDGCKIHLGDDKHIYRYKVLANIRQKLAKYATKDGIDYFQHNCSQQVNRKNYTLYYERYDKGTYIYYGKEYKINERHDIHEVEINNTDTLPIKDRVLIHLKALNLCYNGTNIEDACKEALGGFNG